MVGGLIPIHFIHFGGQENGSVLMGTDYHITAFSSYLCPACYVRKTQREAKTNILIFFYMLWIRNISLIVLDDLARVNISATLIFDIMLASFRGTVLLLMIEPCHHRCEEVKHYFNSMI